MYWSGRQTRTTNRKMVHMEESRQGTWFGTVYFFWTRADSLYKVKIQKQA